MAAAFLAMNQVSARCSTSARAEAATPGVADARAGARGQFIFDVQTHFVRED